MAGHAGQSPEEARVNYWLLTLSMMNLLLLTLLLFSWLTKNKNKVEDQRMTKGLQLLQNKISILQDLSDKSDEQVRKWVHLIEQKSIEVQNQLTRSDEKMAQIETVLAKALDVSKAFSEQVPHETMAERQKTSRYVQAARLAHQGLSADEISQKVDLSVAEIEIIIKMNRHQLQFSEEDLPAWVDAAGMNAPKIEDEQQEMNEFTAQLKRMNQSVSESAFDIHKPDMSSMNRIKQQFADSVSMNSAQIPQTFLDEKKDGPETTVDGKTIKPFQFRKIVVNKN
jgi:hypothetical protein